MNPTFRILLFSLLFVYSLSGFAQTKLSSLDLNRVKQKSVRQFIANLEKQGVFYFEDLHASVDSQTDSTRFDSNCHYFENKHTINEVWNAYLTAHPAKIWNGRIVSFGFIYLSKERQFVFLEDSYPGLEPGQIFFIEMRVFFGLVHFPVCFMVTEIDQVKHFVTFSYVAEGKSKGAQTIQLNANDLNHTEIKHSSIHQTDNILRDKTLYPVYHKKAIKEVHRNIRNFLIDNGR